MNLPPNIPKRTALFLSRKDATIPDGYMEPLPIGHRPYEIDLAEILPKKNYNKRFAKEIRFHATGDSGDGYKEKKDDKKNRDRVIKVMEGRRAANQTVAFFYHLGDVVYDYGEKDENYKTRYGQQFYDSFSSYGAPKFAIAGSHDHYSDRLNAFFDNFCNPEKIRPHNIGYQPNHYWKMKAPFVDIIGLSTNYASSGYIDWDQLRWSFDSVIQSKGNGKPFIVAMYFPPLANAVPDHQDENGSPALYKLTNEVYKRADYYPHLVLSGHWHNYQRLTHTRITGDQTVHVIAGCGGYSHYDLAAQNGAEDMLPDSSVVRMESNNSSEFGFLEVLVNRQEISGKFITADGVEKDAFSIDIQTRHIK